MMSSLMKVSSENKHRLINFSMVLGALMTTIFGFLSILYPPIAFVILYYGYSTGMVPQHIGYLNPNSDLDYSRVGFLIACIGGILILASLMKRDGQDKTWILVGALLEIIGGALALVGININRGTFGEPSAFMPWIGTWLMLAGILSSFVAIMLKFQLKHRQLIFFAPLLILFCINIWLPPLLIFDFSTVASLYRRWNIVLSSSFAFLGIVGCILAISQILSYIPDMKKT